MTTNHHTAIATGAAANASIINNPLGDLDSQIESNAIGVAANASNITTNTSNIAANVGDISDLSAIVATLGGSGSGSGSTLTDGATANAATTIDLDDSTGFLVGAKVSYTLSDSSLEYNTVATVPGATSITVTTGVDAAGSATIPDNTHITIVSPGEWLAALSVNYGNGFEPSLADAVNVASSNVYHVKAYGATGAASSATNTTAINAAITAAAGTGGTVVFESGVTYAMDTITVLGGVALDGNGATITQQNTGTGDMLTATSVDNITIRNLRFDGNKDNQAYPDTWHGIFLDTCENVRILDCYIKHTSRTCAKVQDCTHVWIERNECIDAGVITTGTDQIIHQFNVQDCEDVIVRGNYMHSTETTTGDDDDTEGMAAILVKGSQNVRVESNYLDNFYSEVIQVGADGPYATNPNYGEEGTVASRPRKVVVTNNIITGSKNAYGIHIGPNADDVIVSNNIVYSSASTGILIGTWCRRITITDNTVLDSGGYGIGIVAINYCTGGLGVPYFEYGNHIIANNRVFNSSSHGISITGGNPSVTGVTQYGVHIHGNYVLNSGQTAGTYIGGIQLGAYSENCLVEGNYCTDDQEPPTQRYGINIVAAGINNIVRNNDFRGNGVAGAYLTGARYVVAAHANTEDQRYRSLVNSRFKWTSSGSGTSEYYLVAAAGTDVDTLIPRSIIVDEDGTPLVAGTAGSLAAGEWAYDDNDTLGFDTVYVRLTDSADPDSKADDFLTAMMAPSLFSVSGTYSANATQLITLFTTNDNQTGRKYEFEFHPNAGAQGGMVMYHGRTVNDNDNYYGYNPAAITAAGRFYAFEVR